MTGLEWALLAALVVVAGLCVLILLSVRGGGATTAWRAEVVEVRAALDASRADAAGHARAARDELGTSMDRLGKTLASSTGERLDGLLKSVSTGRIEDNNRATALRSELLGQFDTLAKSVG